MEGSIYPTVYRSTFFTVHKIKDTPTKGKTETDTHTRTHTHTNRNKDTQKEPESQTDNFWTPFPCYYL